MMMVILNPQSIKYFYCIICCGNALIIMFWIGIKIFEINNPPTNKFFLESYFI